MNASTTTRISIGVDALVSALGALSRAIERRQTIAVLSNVLIEVDSGLCRLTASDLDMWVTTTVPLPDALSPKAAITMPAQLLQDIARKLPKGAEADLTWGGPDATLSCGRARYRINTLPASDYPSLTEPDWPVTVALPAKSFRRAFDKTAFAISNEEIRYYLNGTFIHAIEEDGEVKLVAVATDGHRLSKLVIPAPVEARGLSPSIVPRKAVGEIIRMLDGRDDDVEVSVSDAKLSLTAGSTRLVTKLIDGTFPDYERVIPREGSRLAVIDVGALAGAAARVSTVSGERGKAVKLSFGGQTLTLEVKNPDAGDAFEEITAEYEGDPLEIGFNARYLAEALQSVDADTIRMQLGDPGAPAVVTSVAASDHLVVIMPMRV
jgi:DNA polymerase-3 subunit beta